MVNIRSPFSRLWQIRRVINKYGLVHLLAQLKLSATARLFCKLFFSSKSQAALENPGQAIRHALQDLGPIFVKLGQTLSTRPDLLPADIAEQLSKLQDEVPPFDQQQALRIMKGTYQDEFETIFESVEAEPLASASVAQVHTARLKKGLAIKGKNGQHNHEVIIKILRPGIKEVIEQDLNIMHFVAGLLQKHWQRGEQFKPKQVTNEYQNTIFDELNLRQEAANCSQMAANFEDSGLIYVPQVYWDYTHQHIMVMERIYGTSIRDIDTLNQKGIDLAKLANDGVAIFFKQAFEDNFFHADMHPGNIFVADKGQWIAVDFGIMGTLNDSDKRYLAQMLLGFFNRDYRSIAQAHIRAQWVPEHVKAEEFEAAIRMVCEPNFAKPISEISFGTVLLELFQTIRRFEIPLQPQLILLYKTLLNIEGLGRQLYPQLNLWDTAKPFLETWMKQQLSPLRLIEDLKHDWPRWRAAAPKLLEYIEHLDTVKQENPPTNQQQGPLFHHLFGFSLAIIGFGITALTQLKQLDTSLLTQAAPWFGAIGLIWAFVKSR